MANNSNLSKRAALRQQQELQERQARNRKILGIVLGAIALVVVVVVGVVVAQTIARNNVAVGPQQNPPNMTAANGIAYKGNGTPAAGVPHLTVYEDYQCPTCAVYEEHYGGALDALVNDGKITVEFVTATFMEDKIRNDSSTRPAMAAAAADAVGKYRAYQKVAFSHQSPSGAGYTDQQLRVDFPAEAGITGDALVTFQKLYDERVFADFVKKADKAFTDSGFGGTPTYAVKGKKLEFTNDAKEILIQPTAEDLLRAINEANS